MSEMCTSYGLIPTYPLAQKIEGIIDPSQEGGYIRIVVDVFPQPDMRDELLDEVTALYSEFLERLHLLRAGQVTSVYQDHYRE